MLWVGKTRNASLGTLIEDYLERINRLVPCGIQETRDVQRGKGVRAEKAVEAEAGLLERALKPGELLVALDERGCEYSSLEFARWLDAVGKRGVREIVFMIGGPDGIAPRVRQRAHLTLSLGRMTWTHEMCRVLLLEQIFRSLCILRNIPYHR